MRRIRCVRKPVEVEVLEVTKAELKELFEKNPVSISDSDNEWLAIECGNDEFVGYIAGEIDDIGNKDKIADLWFINKHYFVKNYEIKEEN